MPRTSVTPPPDDAPVGEDDARASAGPSAPDLSGLPIAGLTPRRVGAVVGVLLAAWVIVIFARQVGDASAATGRANQIAATNVQRAREVSALQRELDLIGRQRYIEQQARGYGLGGEHETAFTLAAGAPELPDDAPGSAAVRLGTADARMLPLERWLTVLFGP